MEHHSVSYITLIVLSGLGVIHGFLLAGFLFLGRKGNRVSNRLLGFLLVVLSFRVGKSILLEFAHELHVKIVFTGLGSMMLIGPLFFLFSKSLLLRPFALKKRHFLHFIPAIFGIGFGVWLEPSHLRSLPIWIFVVAYTLYYGHYLVYLLLSYRMSRIHSGDSPLFRLVILGLLAIWVVYVLNLFDESIPYIIGPILYSVVAYSISYVVIRHRFIDKVPHEKYKSTPMDDRLREDIYARIQRLMVETEEFKNPDLTLKSLSERLHQSPQVISMVINQTSGTNFNSFINLHRIEEASKQLRDPKMEHFTISTIATDSGFNSISSFNAAFKKHKGMTPQIFRNRP